MRLANVPIAHGGRRGREGEARNHAGGGEGEGGSPLQFAQQHDGRVGGRRPVVGWTTRKSIAVIVRDPWIPPGWVRLIIEATAARALSGEICERWVRRPGRSRRAGQRLSGNAVRPAAERLASGVATPRGAAGRGRAA